MKRIKRLPEQSSIAVRLVATVAVSVLFVGLCNCSSHHGHLQLSPAVTQVVHYVNASHIVHCNSYNATRVRWLNSHNDVIEEQRGRVHVEEMSGGTAVALVFEAIALADKGNWTCQGEDGTLRSFHLVVNQAITFMDTPPVQSAAEDKDAIIRCMVKGDPEPTVSWYYNGQVLNLPTPKYKKVADGLVIKKVTKSDSGEYTCKAYQVSTTISNTKEQTIRLNIQHKPVSPHRASAQIAFGYVHGTVNLSCEAIAEPAANFTWSRHKKPLSPKTHLIHSEGHLSTLQVIVNDSKSFGDYHCRAQNGLGQLDRVITLQQGAKPEKPKYVELRGFSSDTFDVDVGAIRTSKVRHPMDINGYRFEITSVADYRQNGGNWDSARVLDLGFEDGITYLINNLASNTSYLLRVAARNPAGYSDWTEPKQIQTQAKEPFGLPPTSSTATLYAGRPDMLATLVVAIGAAVMTHLRWTNEMLAAAKPDSLRWLGRG